jgi:hypothetical protein
MLLLVPWTTVLSWIIKIRNFGKKLHPLEFKHRIFQSLNKPSATETKKPLCLKLSISSIYCCINRCIISCFSSPIGTSFTINWNTLTIEKEQILSIIPNLFLSFSQSFSSLMHERKSKKHNFVILLKDRLREIVQFFLRFPKYYEGDSPIKPFASNTYRFCQNRSIKPES